MTSDSNMPGPRLRLGTRGSPLARVQAEAARARLAAAWPDLRAEGAIEVVVVKTTGDIEQKRRLAEIGGKGLFTKELEDALVEGRIDAAVHSMKDVPTWLPPGLCLGAMLPRADPRDAWFSPWADSIDGLPSGAVVGTTSLRRQAQVLRRRPDVKVVTFRGNVGTRLDKLHAGEAQGTLLALAGLQRMDCAHLATAILSSEEMLPAVGQGAVGLEHRADDVETARRVAAVDDAPTHLRVGAERACLDVLDGSCRTPIGVLAELFEQETRIRLRALVAAPDGRQSWAGARTGAATEAEALARDLGAELRAKAGEAFFAALADTF